MLISTASHRLVVLANVLSPHFGGAVQAKRWRGWLWRPHRWLLLLLQTTSHNIWTAVNKRASFLHEHFHLYSSSCGVVWLRLLTMVLSPHFSVAGTKKRWTACLWNQFAWLFPLLQAVSGWDLVPIAQQFCQKVAASCKSRKALVNNTWWGTTCVTVCVCVCVCVTLQLLRNLTQSTTESCRLGAAPYALLEHFAIIAFPFPQERHSRSSPKMSGRESFAAGDFALSC